MAVAGGQGKGEEMPDLGGFGVQRSCPHASGMFHLGNMQGCSPELFILRNCEKLREKWQFFAHFGSVDWVKQDGAAAKATLSPAVLVS